VLLVSNLSSLQARRADAAPLRRLQESMRRVLTGPARSSKRLGRSLEITDRLLTIGADRRQLADAAKAQTPAFAQQEAPRGYGDTLVSARGQAR
jgi:hypothetical protein